MNFRNNLILSIFLVLMWLATYVLASDILWHIILASFLIIAITFILSLAFTIDSNPTHFRRSLTIALTLTLLGNLFVNAIFLKTEYFSPKLRKEYRNEALTSYFSDDFKNMYPAIQNYFDTASVLQNSSIKSMFQQSTINNDSMLLLQFEITTIEKNFFTRNKWHQLNITFDTSGNLISSQFNQINPESAERTYEKHDKLFEIMEK